MVAPALVAVSQPHHHQQDLPLAILLSVVVQAGMLFLLFWVLAQRQHRSEPNPLEKREITLVTSNVEIVRADSPTLPMLEEVRFVDTSFNQPTEDAPENPAFESDRNTSAASETAATETGSEIIPGMDGSDLPGLELADMNHVAGELAATKIAISVAPEPMDDLSEATNEQTPSISEQFDATTGPARAKAEEFLEMLENPDLEPDLAQIEDPESDFGMIADPTASLIPDENFSENEILQAKAMASAAQAFLPESNKRQSESLISNQGSAAVDAAETPKGRYLAQVGQVLKRHWLSEVDRRADLRKIGWLSVVAYVNAEGRFEDIRVIEQDCDPVLLDLSIRAMQMSQLPPIPPEVAEQFLGGKIPYPCRFMISSR